MTGLKRYLESTQYLRLMSTFIVHGDIFLVKMEFEYRFQRKAKVCWSLLYMRCLVQTTAAIEKLMFESNNRRKSYEARDKGDLNRPLD